MELQDVITSSRHPVVSVKMELLAANDCHVMLYLAVCVVVLCRWRIVLGTEL